MAPGTDQQAELEGATKRVHDELEAEGVTRDESIVIRYTKSFEEYDQLVKQNVVIIDLWAATAINAVLEAIALDAPFLVRELPGTVEYLGQNYPFLFKDFEDLQKLLEDEDHLRMLLLKGHNYLKEMDKRRFTLPEFTNAVKECAIKDGNKKPFVAFWSMWK